MPAEAAAIVRTWPVGRRVVTLTCPPPRPGEVACIAVEWSPDAPRRLSATELRAYRRGRDAALAEVGAALGGPILIVET
jgi:hypothetical protein